LSGDAKEIIYFLNFCPWAPYFLKEALLVDANTANHRKIKATLILFIFYPYITFIQQQDSTKPTNGKRHNPLLI